MTVPGFDSAEFIAALERLKLDATQTAGLADFLELIVERGRAIHDRSIARTADEIALLEAFRAVRPAARQLALTLLEEWRQAGLRQ